MSSLSAYADAAAGSKVLLTLSGVSKVYDNGTVAVRDANLRIREGELLSFVGPSGCGKSTLFRLIAGLGQPSEGTIDILGGTPEEARRDGGVSYVFQDATLMPWSSVLDNVTLPLKLAKTPKAERLRRAERALERVGLSDYAKAYPRQLSGGMKMRVSIARALISEPRLLLMDEPFGALDEITRQSLQNELLEIRRNDPSMTVLFVTHNVFEAVFLSTRIAVMSARPGRISEEIEVPVPYPREESFRASPAFGEMVRKVSDSLSGGSA